MHDVAERLFHQVIKPGICVGCGACVALDSSGKSKMEFKEIGPVPNFSKDSILPELAWDVCPGKGINYPVLYEKHYGSTPTNWITGRVQQVRIGYASNDKIRKVGASGGVITQTLIHLLESGRIDGAIVVKQGVPKPELASAVIARTRQEIIDCAQSIYVPVSCLDILPHLVEGEIYAITLVPEQSAALRFLQADGNEPSLQVKYILGPYTGTAIYPEAINCFLRSCGVKRDDGITSLKWREGDWPGYLEIITNSGKVVRSKKVYYNYLIPFFVTQTSLQSMDFVNEFADLAVGDAWSPVYEKESVGHSVVATRSCEMEEVILEMVSDGMLAMEEIDALKSTDMHGHMIDFKKRGSYIRNRFRQILGKKHYDCGLRPEPITTSRVVVELVISGIFFVARSKFARALLSLVPESIIGPIFNRVRLLWKAASKPTKRKGLKSLRMVPIKRK